MNLETREGASAFLQQVDGFPPTSDQLDVIMGGAEPSLVIAGAGAGKTKTMSLRVVYHVAAGNVEPAEVLGLTFTKKAANELSSRITTMLRKAARLGGTAINEETVILSRPVVSTYNAFASSIATEHGLIVGVDPSARVINDAEKFQIINDLVRGWEEDLSEHGSGKVSTLTTNVMDLAATILNNELTTDQVRESLTEFRDHIVAAGAEGLAKSKKLSEFLSTYEHRFRLLNVVDAYLAYKSDHQLVEFADQVSVASRVLQKRPDIVQSLKDEHRLVLLDEYQDTSVNQSKFLRQIFGGGHNVTAVGDPNQAIYGWRGASADALADYKHSFSEPETKMPQYSLSTAFRNKGEILEAANAVSSSLRQHAEKSGLHVEPLEAFTKTGGEVELAFDVMEEDSYKTVAADIARYRQEHAANNNGQGPSIAVLCRARASMEPMAKALAELKIPYIEHGNQSAISQPEVVTIRGLLRTVATPARGQAMSRLLSYLNISPADMEAVNQVRNALGRKNDVELSFAEALPHLDQADLSDVARGRLNRLNRWIQTLTEARYSRIEDLVSLAIRITGIETEVFSRSSSGGIGQASLSSLQRLASGYSESMEGATLEAFLDWLDLVEEKEHGGSDELPLADLASEAEGITKDELENPNTVTIMTIHGAKGLEWDYVAIVDMKYGGFDLLTTNPRSPWISNVAKVPMWLQEDAHSLPEWRWKGDDDAKSLEASFGKWLSEDFADHENRERRRLAYVAMTRPRTRLLMAGYWYKKAENAEEAEEQLKDPKKTVKYGPSRLLNGINVPTSGVSMTELPAIDIPEEEAAEQKNYMADQQRGATRELLEAKEFVESRVPLSVGEMEERVQDGSGWIRDSLTDLVALLDGDDEAEFELERITANGVVTMATDQVQFRLDTERPIPSEPAHAARLGQQVHEYIASRFGAPRTGDLLDVSGDADQVLGLDLSDPHVARLVDAFETLPLVKSGTAPIAVEAPVDVVVAGIPMRGTIDAVFPDGQDPDTGEERVRIVDWKTGRYPSDLENKELQLHLYRLAWAKVTGMDPRNISATFAYLGEKDEKKRIHDVPAMDEETLTEKITTLVNAVKEAR